MKILRLVNNTAGRSFYLALDITNIVLYYAQIVYWCLVINNGYFTFDTIT